MTKLECSQVAIGMRFSLPVFFDDGKNMFIAEGNPVKQKDINVLIRWEIPFLQTEGRLLADYEAIKKDVEDIEELADLDEMEEIIEDGLTSEVSAADLLKLPAIILEEGLYCRYNTLIENLDTIFVEIKKEHPIENRVIDAITENVYNLVAENRPEVVGFILGGEINGMELAKSSINVAILTLIISEYMGHSKQKTLEIVTGALLHDVGMMRINDTILNKKVKLSDDERKTIYTHTVFGYKIIAKDMVYSNEVAHIAMQHHEWWNGTGYPNQRKGTEIDVGARIVAVADAFEAMVSQKSYRASMIGYHAMKNLLSDNSIHFDPDVLRAFVQSIGIYPIGSIVLLNNSAIARVIEGHTEKPLRPKLRILMDEHGAIYLKDKGSVVDLLDTKELFIARAIDPKELSAAGSSVASQQETRSGIKR